MLGREYCADFCSGPIFRLNPDGTRDSTFQTSFDPWIPAKAIALQDDGRVVAALDNLGTIVGNRIVNRGRIFRFHSNGQIDTTFTPAVITEGDLPSGIIIEQDGKILIWGCATKILGASAAGLIRLNSDGSVDKTFQLALKSRTSNVDLCINGVLPLTDGRLYVVGSIAGGDVFRVHADGSVDSTFAREITPTPPGVLLPTGTELVAAGRFLRLGTNSALHSAFDSTLDGQAIAVAKDGAFLAFSESKIRRLQSSGIDDNAFHTISVEVSAQVGSILPQLDGKFLITGDFSFVGGVPRPGVARLDPNGALDPTFTPTDGIPHFGDFFDAPVLGLLRSQPGTGQSVVAGLSQFQEDSGPVPGSSLGRLNADGSRDRTFSPSWLSSTNQFIELAADIAVQADGKIILLSAFNQPPRLIRLLPDGSEDHTFQPPQFPFFPQKIALQPDGRLLVASSSDGGHNSDKIFRPSLIRLNSDGSIDPAFSPSVPAPSWNFNPYGVHLALQPDGKIILGLLPRILRFNADGTWDPSFGVAANPLGAEVNNYSDGSGISMITSADQILVFGKISQVNGQFVKADQSELQVVLLDRDGRYDLSAAQLQTSIRLSDDYSSFTGAAILPDDGALLIAGKGLKQAGGFPSFGLARLQPVPVIQSSRSTPEGKFLIHVGGQSGWIYQIDASTDLANWLPSREEPSSGNTTAITLSLPSSSRQFFRVSVKPRR